MGRYRFLAHFHLYRNATVYNWQGMGVLAGHTILEYGRPLGLSNTGKQIVAGSKGQGSFSRKISTDTDI